MAGFSLTKLSIWSFGVVVSMFDTTHFSQGFSKEKKSRGFVLSFSTFALALFLVIFAQIQYAHIHQMELDAGGIHQLSTPGRVLRDIALDFNILVGNSIRIDQNSTNATTFISGNIPSPLNHSANLLRYQSGLFSLGRDVNTSIFLDLNNTMDANLVRARTNKGLVWTQNMDANDITITPLSSLFYPNEIIITILSDAGWENILTSVTNINPLDDIVLTTINYSDTNSTHSTAGSWTLGPTDFLSLQYDYLMGGTTYTKTITVGDGGTTPFQTTLSGDTQVNWKYTLAYTTPNDSNGTRAGYDFNTTIRGIDFNSDTNTIWTYGG